MAKDLETRIEALYKLPLDEFTSARNALAKETGDASVKQLTKPPVPAWAVNQLYWDRRDDYDGLVAAATDMRRTHKAVIEGKKGDLRAATREHDRAIELALKATVALMKERAQPVTDATRQAILNTLRAIPSNEEPGRLTRVLAPGGFEMLAGVAPATKDTKATKGTKSKSAEETEAKGAETTKAKGAGETKAKGAGEMKAGASPASRGAEAKAAKEKAQREAAERAVREAEHQAKRTEFESARAARDVARAEKQHDAATAAVERAREALETAEREATAARRAVDAAVRGQDAADRKARDAASALDAARARLGT